MAQVIALLTGLVALLFTFPGTIPFLGWLNWVGLPIALLGVLIGHLGSGPSKWGRNICIAFAAWAAFRLFIGGGLI